MSKLKVLFLCTGNSCRSQMAEGWGRHLFGQRFDFYSAGTSPNRLDGHAVDVMDEEGIDISRHRSKSVSEFDNQTFDLVVTVCDSANETCPIFPGAIRKIHRGFDDPPRLSVSAKSKEEALDHYRRVRDEIRAFIETLPKELGQ